MGAFQDVFVATFVVSVMLSVGLDIHLSQLLKVLRSPALLAAALVINHIVIPVIAYAVSAGFALAGPAALGLLLCASTPGGPVGTLLTQHARGNVAYAVTLVMLMNVINTVSSPLTLGLVAPGTAAAVLPFGATVLRIALYQLLPLAIGMTVKHYRAALATKMSRLVSALAKAALAAIMIGMIATQGHLLFAGDIRVPLAIEVVLMSKLALGWWACPGERPDRIGLSLSSVISNLGLSLLLVSVFENDTATFTVLLFGLLMILNGLAASAVYRLKGGQR